MSISEPLRQRLFATGVHTVISAVVAIGVALMTLGLWYPGAFSAIAGGRHLFLLVLSVDVVMGPVLTFVVFDKRKPQYGLIRDMVVIAALQLSALVYGLNTVVGARPIALVLESDRFRLVSAKDVRTEELPGARPEYQELPLTGGPWLLGTRSPVSGAERFAAIDLALKGFDIGQRPTYWQPYSESRVAALSRSRPVSLLLTKFPARSTELEDLLRDAKLTAAGARFLPLLTRSDWVVILDANGDIAAFAPFDGF